MMGNTKFCEQCGAPLPDDGRFCEKCGAPRPDGEAVGDTGKMGTVPLATPAPRAGSTPDPYDTGSRQGSPNGIVKWVLLGMLAALLLVFAGFAMGWFGKSPGTDAQAPVDGKASVDGEKKAEKVEATDKAEEKKTETAKETTPSAKTDAYTLPDSDKRRYSKSELSGMSDAELRIARNEIYARHGYRFMSSDLQAHFEGCSWYDPTTAPGEFDEGLLSGIERDNVSLILSLESHEGEYVLPDSSVRRYSRSEISGLSSWELKVARNEIYARHGRQFDSEDLRNYFAGCSWYEGRTPPSKFDEGLLNDIEKQNIELIASVENGGSKATPKYATGYVLSDSDTHRYTRSELSGLSSWELKVARNEIYARHGYVFKSDDLREHFGNCSWYSPNPRYSPGEFDESLLNDIERANVDLISSME